MLCFEGQRVSPDDGGVELSGVQVNGGEGSRGETFTETRQHGPHGLHVCVFMKLNGKEP